MLWLAQQQADAIKKTNDQATYNQAQAKVIKFAQAMTANPGAAPLGLNIQAALEAVGMQDWQAHIVWSWGDMGPMEGAVQKEIVMLDAETQHHMFQDCIWPGGLFGRVGRACIMQKYACDAARNKFDIFAFKMTAATQKHNPDAVSSLATAGPWKVAEFLRNDRGCK
jgi:hypothetical protein